MSIRWIRNVLLDGEKATLEIQLGDARMGEKCYTRINNEIERYFDSLSEARDEIVAQGAEILRQRLHGRKVTYPDGRDYDWT